jgi:hypothetical protein
MRLKQFPRLSSGSATITLVGGVCPGNYWNDSTIISKNIYLWNARNETFKEGQISKKLAKNIKWPITWEQAADINK